MMRLLSALVVTACLATSTQADPDPDNYHPAGKEALQAIHDRGVVLRAGKRHYFVVVPRVNPSAQANKSAKFYRARIYFGDAKTLFNNGDPGTSFTPDETASIGSPFGSAQLVYRGNRAVLQCFATGTSEPREIALEPVSDSVKTVLPSPKLVTYRFPYVPYLFAREEHGTTYYYVDRPPTTFNDSTEFRLFVGKRGAMKRLPLKEQASDAEADILVTTTGTLTIRKKRWTTPRPGTPPAHAEAEAVLFGTDKKRATLELLDLRNNHELIYRDLGIYVRDTDGVPCEVL